MKSNKYAVVILLAAALQAVPGLAGYLDTSPNWKAPQTVPMSKKTAIGVANRCSAIKARTAEGGNAGTMIVAGPHPTAQDPKLHLTARLYDTRGNNDKSCHIYVNKIGVFQSCNCQ